MNEILNLTMYHLHFEVLYDCRSRAIRSIEFSSRCNEVTGEHAIDWGRRRNLCILHPLFLVTYHKKRVIELYFRMCLLLLNTLSFEHGESNKCIQYICVRCLCWFGWVAKCNMHIAASQSSARRPSRWGPECRRLFFEASTFRMIQCWSVLYHLDVPNYWYHNNHSRRIIFSCKLAKLLPKSIADIVSEI